MRAWTLAAAFLAVLAEASERKAAITWESLKLDDKTELAYALALPSKEALEKPCPLLIVLPGGPGTKEMAEGAIASLAGEGTARGWIVASPEAPGGRLFFQGGEACLEPLVARLRKTYRVEEGQVHLAGISNGGIGAFRALARFPDLWASILTFPGAALQEDMPKVLEAARGKPVTMYAGELDGKGYEKTAQRMAAIFQESHVPCTFHLMKGEGHIMSLSGERLMDDLERHRAEVKARARK